MLGIIIGVAASKKVNQPNLSMGLILTLSATIIITLASNDFSWLPIPWLLAVVASISLADEVCHDRLNQSKSPFQLFRFRPLLKLTILALALAAQVEAIYAFGFLSFDFTYDAADLLLKTAEKKQ